MWFLGPGDFQTTRFRIAVSTVAAPINYWSNRFHCEEPILRVAGARFAWVLRLVCFLIYAKSLWMAEIPNYTRQGWDAMFAHTCGGEGCFDQFSLVCLWFSLFLILPSHLLCGTSWALGCEGRFVNASATGRKHCLLRNSPYSPRLPSVGYLSSL